MVFAAFVLVSLIFFGVSIFWFKFIRLINTTEKELVKFNSQLNDLISINHFRGSDEYLIINKLIAHTLKNKITIREDSQDNNYSLQDFSSIWNRKNIFSHINISLYDAIPNIVIGVGLTLTFIFLALALNDVRGAISGGSNSDSALMSLLGYTGIKFLTSLAGLICSILWVIFSKIKYQKIDVLILNINNNLNYLIPPYAAEKTIALQNEKLIQLTENSYKMLKWFKNEFSHTLNTHFTNQTNNMRYQFENLAALLTQLNQHNVEQACERVQPLEHSLQRLEQDLSIQIGVSVAKALQPVLTRHKEALEKMADKTYDIQDKALQKMVKMFLEQLTHASHEEMTNYSNSIRELGESLNESTKNLKLNTDRASEYFAATISQSAQTFEKSVNTTTSKMDQHAQENISEIVLSYGSKLEQVSKSFHQTQSTVADAFKGNILESIAHIDKLKYSVADTEQLNETLNGKINEQIKLQQLAAAQQTELNQTSKNITSKLQESFQNPVKIDQHIHKIHQTLEQQQRAIHDTTASINTFGLQLKDIQHQIAAAQVTRIPSVQNVIHETADNLKNIENNQKYTDSNGKEPQLRIVSQPSSDSDFVDAVSDIMKSLLILTSNDLTSFRRLFDASPIKEHIINILLLDNSMLPSYNSFFDVVLLSLKTPLSSGANILVYVRGGASEHRIISLIFGNLPIGSVISETIKPAQLKQNLSSTSKILLSKDHIIKQGIVSLK